MAGNRRPKKFRESDSMTKYGNDGIERRLFPRVKADVYYRAPRIAPRKRAIHDISLGGVRINCDEKLEVGTELEMEFYLPDGNAIAAIAKVRWISKLPQGSDALYTAGLEFMHLTTEAAEQLRKVCVPDNK
jgi:c-di-GMP-binding flagellar brake protein YcgR